MPANATRVILGIPRPRRHRMELLDFNLHDPIFSAKWSWSCSHQLLPLQLRS